MPQIARRELSVKDVPKAEEAVRAALADAARAVDPRGSIRMVAFSNLLGYSDRCAAPVL